MNITVANLSKTVTKTQSAKLPGVLKDSYTDVVEMLDLYNDDTDIKKFIDTYVSKLNQHYAKAAPPANDKKPDTKTKKSKYSKGFKFDGSSGQKYEILNNGEHSPVEDTIDYEVKTIMASGKTGTSHMSEELITDTIEAAKKADTKKPGPSTKKPATKAPSTKQPATKATKATTQHPATQVAQIAIEVRFIKRYVLMDGKRKTRKQLLAFINTLQRAIEKKQIRKTSKYATEIRHIQKELVKIYNDENVGNSFTFKLDDSDKKVIAKFTKIASSQQQRTSVRLISRFIGIHGRTAVKDKAETLLKAIKAAFKNKKIPTSDPYRKQVKEVQGNLEKYIKAHDSKLQIGISELKGLQGIAGLMEQDGNVKPGDKVELPFGNRDTVTKVTDNAVFLKKHKGLVNKKFVRKLDGIAEISNTEETDVMSSVDVAKMEHHPIGFTGKWLSLIGDPVLPYKMMFWSKPGLGKSSLAIEYAKYIADNFNKQILYVSVEEGYAYTIQEKFNRLNAVHPNIAIAPELPGDLSPYNVIFIDSVTYMDMTPDDFKALKKKYPSKCFVLIFQATVDGNYRGSKEWEHEVDVSVYINENGYAKASKSRFGGNGTIKVFKGEPDQIYKFTNLQDAEKFVSNRNNEKLRIVVGDDGKKWVTNPDKARELSKQGYEIY